MDLTDRSNLGATQGGTPITPPVGTAYGIGITTDSTKSGLTGTTSISRMTTQKWVIKY